MIPTIRRILRGTLRFSIYIQSNQRETRYALSSFRSRELPRKAKVGRPKLPKGEAKGRIVPVRFRKDDLRTLERIAKANDKTISEWIRSAVVGRNIKRWYASCADQLHIPLFENRPSNKDYCDGCGAIRELHGIGEGYVSYDEAAKGRADSTPLSNPESTPPPTRL
jgi:hypothetical protein